MISFKGAHSVKDVMLTCVRWYAACPLSYAFVGEARNDGKSYAGASCQPVSRADADNIAYYSGIAWNTSTTSNLGLDCPIIRDTSGSLASGGCDHQQAQRPLCKLHDEELQRASWRTAREF
jgi:hypothetical protein